MKTKLDLLVMGIIAILGVIFAAFAFFTWSAANQPPAAPAASALREESTAESTEEGMAEAVGEAVVEVTITPQPTFTETPTPTEIDQPADGDYATLLIVNDSSIVICYVQFSATVEESWGQDQLGETEVIDPGQEREWNDIEPGEYDLRASDCEQNEIDVNMRVMMEAGEVTTWTFTNDSIYPTFTAVPTVVPDATQSTSAASAIFIVENRLDATVCYVLISPAGLDEWSDDLLQATETLPPDTTSVPITTVAPGLYDLQGLDCDQNELIMLEDVEIVADQTNTVVLSK